MDTIWFSYKRTYLPPPPTYQVIFLPNPVQWYTIQNATSAVSEGQRSVRVHCLSPSSRVVECRFQALFKLTRPVSDLRMWVLKYILFVRNTSVCCFQSLACNIALSLFLRFWKQHPSYIGGVLCQVFQSSRLCDGTDTLHFNQCSWLHQLCSGLCLTHTHSTKQWPEAFFNTFSILFFYHLHRQICLCIGLWALSNMSWVHSSTGAEPIQCRHWQRTSAAAIVLLTCCFRCMASVDKVMGPNTN